MIRTHVSRVAPDWDLWKGALMTELQRRSKCGKGNKVEQRVSQANLLVGTHGHSPYLHSAAVAFEKQPAGQFFFLDMAWPEEVG